MARAAVSEALRELLEGPCGLIIGAVGADGLPHAGYAWGLRVLDAGTSIRVIAESGPAFNVGAAMAVTGSDVGTYRTIQIKGVIRSAEAATPEDLYLAKVHIEQFVSEVVTVEQSPREAVESFPSIEFDVYVVDIEEVFDQSPGPNAGTAVDARAWRAT